MISADDMAASHPTRLPGSGLTHGVRPLGAASGPKGRSPGIRRRGRCRGRPFISQYPVRRSLP
jgi:hypothetical protein